MIDALAYVWLRRANISPRNFSNGKAVDSIETEKSRIILHELEPDWWILAVGTSVELLDPILIRLM